MPSYTQYRIVGVDEDAEIGLKQLNEILKNMCMVEMLVIHNIVRVGNFFEITYQKTTEANASENL